MNEHFSRLLTQQGYYFGQTYKEDMKLRYLKERLCYVSADPKAEREKPEDEIKKSCIMDNKTV